MTDPAPGWYPDNAGRQRWWDGTAWTDRTQDGQDSALGPRKRPIWPWILGGSLLAVIAVIAVTVLVISVIVAPSSHPRPAAETGGGSTSNSSRAPKNSVDDGIVVGNGGDGAVRIVTYVDYLCPFCAQFESANGDQIAKWVDQDKAVLEVHPVAILDRLSLGTRYSSRAANAAACVADSSSADSFLEFSALLYENQPQEQSEGLEDSALIDFAVEAGAADSAADCIRDEQFGGWIAEATKRALSDPLPGSAGSPLEGTPTVIVNGRQYDGKLDSADTFAEFAALPRS